MSSVVLTYSYLGALVAGIVSLSFGAVGLAVMFALICLVLLTRAVIVDTTHRTG